MLRRVFFVDRRDFRGIPEEIQAVVPADRRTGRVGWAEGAFWNSFLSPSFARFIGIRVHFTV